MMRGAVILYSRISAMYLIPTHVGDMTDWENHCIKAVHFGLRKKSQSGQLVPFFLSKHVFSFSTLVSSLSIYSPRV